MGKVGLGRREGGEAAVEGEVGRGGILCAGDAVPEGGEMVHLEAFDGLFGCGDLLAGGFG